MKSKILIIFVAIFIIVVSVLLLIRQQNKVFLEKELRPTAPATTTAQIKWSTYVNTKYGYRLMIPKEILLQNVSEMDPSSEGKSGSIAMNDIQITAWTLSIRQKIDKTALEHDLIARLDLKSFAETLRQKFIDDKNPNFPYKKITELEEINFAGQKAYIATVTGYADGYGSDTFRYVYFDRGDHKLVIQYSLRGDLSQQIIDTLVFTYDNMAGIPTQDTWLTYENTTHQYRINYPPNGDGEQVFPYPIDEYTRRRPSIGDTIQISTPRGLIGIWSLAPKSTAVHSYSPEPPDAISRIKYLLSLDLKSFVKELCDEQTQTAKRTNANINGYLSPETRTCHVDDIEEGTISGQNSHTFNATGRLDTLLTTVLAPRMLEEYRYTFFENKNREKFLMWYPENEPVFNQILSSFKFVN